jgi:hypothetical protein
MFRIKTGNPVTDAPLLAAANNVDHDSHSLSHETARCPYDPEEGRVIDEYLRSLDVNHFISNSWSTIGVSPYCPGCDPLAQSPAVDPRYSVHPDTSSPCVTGRSNEIRTVLETLRVDSSPHNSVIRVNPGFEAALLVGDSSTMNIPKSIHLQVGEFTVEEIYPFQFHAVRHVFRFNSPAESSAGWSTFLPSGGKSRAVFARSRDHRFVLKSINEKEERFLRLFGLDLFWYYSQVFFHQVPSLILPVMGAFVITDKRTNRRSTYILMVNVDSTTSGGLSFDLKGVSPRRAPHSHPNLANLSTPLQSSSSKTRICADDPFDDRSGSTPCTIQARVLLDDDFRDWITSAQISFCDSSLLFLGTAIKNDAHFLSAMSVVDYSLFLSVPQNSAPHSTDSGVITANIIDYLRPFTWDKKLESVVKTMNINIKQLGSVLSRADSKNEGSQRSKTPTVIRPDLYARRFVSNLLPLFGSHEDVSSLDEVG